MRKRILIFRIYFNAFAIYSCVLARRNGIFRFVVALRGLWVFDTFTCVNRKTNNCATEKSLVLVGITSAINSNIFAAAKGALPYVLIKKRSTSGTANLALNIDRRNYTLSRTVFAALNYLVDSVHCNHSKPTDVVV